VLGEADFRERWDCEHDGRYLDQIGPARVAARFAPVQHYGGFGVGLWLVRRIVEAHGGEIHAANVPKAAGAQFVIRLACRAGTATRVSADLISARRASVLLVEDDDDVREILHMSLRAAGHDVREAANGVEALKSLAEHVPDIVLLDMMMPVMNGPQFLAAVRADERYRRLPIIVVTAWPAEAKSLPGIDGLVSKPVDLGQLLSRSNRALKSLRWARAAPRPLGNGDCGGMIHPP